MITMFTQSNLFNTRSAVINEGPVSRTAINYNIINFKTKKQNYYVKLSTSRSILCYLSIKKCRGSWSAVKGG